MCGCSGKHSYASAHVAAASKDRGYTVREDEVSDRSVKLIVGKINMWPGKVELTSEYASVDVNGRSYVAYFAPAVVPAVDFSI